MASLGVGDYYWHRNDPWGSWNGSWGSSSSASYRVINTVGANTPYVVRVDEPTPPPPKDHKGRRQDPTRQRYLAAPGHFESTAPELVVEAPDEWLRRRVTEVCDEALRDVA